jgi:transposase
LIARQTGLSRPTVLAARAAFARRGAAGICEPQKRKRSRRVLTPELEQRILDTTLKTRPANATHWSARVLAAKLGISRMMVQRLWQRYDIQPHRVEKFKISNDPEFEDKVRDVVGLYLDPPDRARVLCVDEKSQIQALDRTAPILPLRPGLPERQTHDYKRQGTTTLFAAFNILNGKVIGSCLPRHRGKEFIKFLNQLEKEVPPGLDVHLILDNYSTRKSAAVQLWLKPRKRRRFHFHFTPTSSSWLNQVERCFGRITDKMIRRGTFHSVEELERAIYSWLASWNDTPRAFAWKASADVILDKVRRCKELAGTPH